MRRGIRVALALIFATVAWVRPNHAAAADEAGRWSRRTIVPEIGFGFGFGQELTTLRFQLGASVFVIDGLAVGLTLSDTVLLYSTSLQDDFPGLKQQIPTNVFEMTPSLRYVFLRQAPVSPYVQAGVGPSFFNHRGGVFGHWLAAPGVLISLGPHIALDAGVVFFGRFVPSECNAAFDYEIDGQAIRVVNGFCSFGWGPRLGLVAAFGGR